MAKLVVGLGNPGKKYEKTRHNVGFFLLDRLALQWEIPLRKEKFSGLYGEHTLAREKILLLKPQTFMNLSGQCVASWLKFLKIPPENLLVIHDEIDLPLGRMKAQFSAGPAGHRGVASIIECLGTRDFNRLRVGVGHPGRRREVENYVLSGFKGEERELLEKSLEMGLEAVLLFLQKGLDAMAQLVNKRPS